MRNQNIALAPAAAEVINQVSGTYSAPFWDGLVAVTESLDTVRAVKGAMKAWDCYCYTKMRLTVRRISRQETRRAVRRLINRP